MRLHVYKIIALGILLITPGMVHAADSAELIKLHEIPWSIGGKPVLGTYGAERVEDLQRVKDAGMNLVLGGKTELDPATPQGAFCLKNGIKVMPHVTSYLYHGIRLRDPITADQKTIPLYFVHGRREQETQVIQLDDELVRYEKMTESELVNCERGYGGTTPAAHREGMILFWPETCRAEIEQIKDSPNLYGYYVLDDSPGDAVSALRALYKVIRETDPDPKHPVCAGFGDAGSVINLAPGVCDIMMIYWYPVSTNRYDRERTAQEVQHMLSEARERVPGIPFMGIYQAFDGGPAKTGQGVPTPDQLREQLEDFVREGACGLVSFICHNDTVPGWADLPPLGKPVEAANREILESGGLLVRPETPSMKEKRVQPEGHWVDPQPLPGYVPAWYIAAPFEEMPGKMLDTETPPDKGIDPAAIYPVLTGSAGWRVRETTTGTMGLSEIYGQKGLAHAYCEVTSPAEQAVQMRFCSDDDAVVRINGKEVYRYTGVQGLDVDKYVVPVTLPQGTSRIEVKVYNRAGMWAFFMRFTDPEGRPLEGLQFTPTKQ
ncbi:MAG: hypothetical protein IT365_21160 [Candidatus Hydrogenedentes bacterium]|nr:hypothetical protein [Candidatus Hydrogenedentota bacterium]